MKAAFGILAVAVIWGATRASRADQAGNPTVVQVRVDASKRASYRIPPTILGTFLEPIGNSTYNGLWAEILQNPSMEAGMWSAGNVSRMLHEEPALAHASQLGLPLPWEPLDYGQGNRYEIRYG